MKPKPGVGYCPKCKKFVQIHWEDYGIGYYEYGSQKGVDIQWVPECSECEETVDFTTIIDDKEDIDIY